MIILRNQSLAKRTTFHVGGTVELLYVPESTDELISIATQEYHNKKIHVIRYSQFKLTYQFGEWYV